MQNVKKTFLTGNFKGLTIDSTAPNSVRNGQIYTDITGNRIKISGAWMTWSEMQGQVPDGMLGDLMDDVEESTGRWPDWNDHISDTANKIMQRQPI